MRRKTWLIVILVICALCAVTALCSVGGWWAYRTIQATPQATGVSGPSVQGSATSQAGADGVLRLAGGQPPTLDPALVQDSTSAEYVVHLFSGLVRLDEQLEITPDVADSWTISGDGRTYTFSLLPGATFQDGSPITADDFVYSFERACSPALGSPVALAYLGDIAGAEAYAGGQTEHIAGLEVVDATTLAITIDAPKAYFLSKLTYPTAYLVDREQVEGDSDWLSQPNGSGPFVLTEMTADKITLERNARYYRAPAALKGVEYELNGGLPITMYENDQLDIVEVDASEIERVLDPHNPLYAEHHVSPELSVQYLGLNVDRPPFDDPQARQAFAYAIDKSKLAELVLKGTATAAAGVLPPGMPDYDPAFIGLPYDPAKARELWNASRYVREGSVAPIVLSVSGTSGSMPSVEGAIVAMIEENLGVTLMVEQVEWGYFLRDLNQQRYQLFSSGWIADYPDSQNFVDLLFHSASSQNHTGYANPAVDALLERARVERDGALRTQLYRQAESLVVADASWVPLTHGVSYALVKPRVQGYNASAGLYPWLYGISIQE